MFLVGQFIVKFKQVPKVHMHDSFLVIDQVIEAMFDNLIP